MGALIVALDFEMERIASVDAILERSHIPAMDVKVAVERAVGARVADQHHRTVAVWGVKDAIPAAGEWRREVDGSGRLWPGLDRPHHAPSDPDAHAKGQGEPRRAFARQ